MTRANARGNFWEPSLPARIQRVEKPSKLFPTNRSEPSAHRVRHQEFADTQIGNSSAWWTNDPFGCGRTIHSQIDPWSEHSGPAIRRESQAIDDSVQDFRGCCPGGCTSLGSKQIQHDLGQTCIRHSVSWCYQGHSSKSLSKEHSSGARLFARFMIIVSALRHCFNPFLALKLCQALVRKTSYCPHLLPDQRKPRLASARLDLSLSEVQPISTFASPDEYP